MRPALRLVPPRFLPQVGDPQLTGKDPEERMAEIYVAQGQKVIQLNPRSDQTRLQGGSSDMPSDASAIRGKFLFSDGEPFLDI